MDEWGILACSKTTYYSCKPKMSNDRRATTSLQTLFTLHDPSVLACFTSIRPVSIFSVDGDSEAFNLSASLQKDFLLSKTRLILFKSSLCLFKASVKNDGIS